MHMRNIIIKKEHENLKIVVTKRKTILNDKRKIMNEKQILTTPEIHDSLVEMEKKVKKRKTIGTIKGKREASEVDQESIDESEASRDEELVIRECIEVRK